MIRCIECNAKIDILYDLSIGEVIECENCGVELEVIDLDPLEFKIFEEEEK